MIINRESRSVKFIESSYFPVDVLDRELNFEKFLKNAFAQKSKYVLKSFH